MKIFPFAIAVLATVIWPSPSNAEATSGNELFAACSYQAGGNMQEAVKALKCVHYIGGVADTLDVFQNRDETHRTICLPKGVDMGEMQDVATKYLKEHPEQRHYGAASLVLRSWQLAFPCRQGK